MISPADTIASNLWRTHLDHRAFVSHPTPKALPAITHLGSSIPQGSLRSGDNSRISDLPYLTKESTDSPTDCPLPPSPGISPSGSGFGSNFLASMLFYDSDSDDEEADTSVESVNSEAFVPHLPSKMLWSTSRPALRVQIVSGSQADVEPSSPSPVDSGYASRPDTPFLEKDVGLASDVASTCSENSVFSVQKILAESNASPADLKLAHHAACAKQFAYQGPTLPQIVLFDEQGRVVDHALDDEYTGPSRLTSFDLSDEESAYGGLMSADEVSCDNGMNATSRPPVFGDYSLSPTNTPPTASVCYRHCHPAPTFVLESVEEEDVEVEVETQESRGRFSRTCQSKGALDTGASTAEQQVSSHSKLVRQTGQVFNNLLAVPSTATLSLAANKPLPPRPVYNEEDEELEACGLFFSTPDPSYLRLTRELCQPTRRPEIAFGLLKTLPSQAPIKVLNTAYHAAAQGRALPSLVAKCTFDCENGYWASQGGLATIRVPRECPAHGGHGSCRVGDVFHHVAHIPTRDSPSVDYARYAAEIVGVPVVPKPQTLDDFDEDELVLHRSEAIHGPQQRHTAPRSGADYDEFMSGFMDDVDIGAKYATDHSKSAPLGKLGDALKELRNAAMPEAVEKTESVFRVVLAASQFKLGAMSDKLHFKSGHRISASKEKNDFYNVMKERSAVSMKGKWSNMFNKLTR